MKATSTTGKPGPATRLRRVAALLLAGLAMTGCDSASPPADRVEPYVNDSYRGEIFLFEPDTAGPWPTLVLFHGGAWQGGDAGQFFPQCRILARLGYLCAAPTYRVAETHGTRPETAVDDARAALRHLRENARRLGIDTSRLVLGGGSAGGHLAALLATGQQGRQAPADVAALLLFNPMLDLSPGRPDHEYVAHDWEALSPFHQMRQALPPTLIMLGDRDPELPVASAEAFCAKALALGSDCRLNVARGRGHGFFNPGVSRWDFHRTLFEADGFLWARGISLR